MRKTRICQKCQKIFIPTSRHLKPGKRQIFCSSDCRRNHPLDEFYFEEITTSKLHTLGQIITTSNIIDHQTIEIVTNEITFEKIQKTLKTTYKLENAQFGLKSIWIRSEKMVNFLIPYLERNPMYQSYPPFNVLSGVLDTHCYKTYDNHKEFRHKSIKLCLEVMHLVGGELYSETYKDVPKGVLGCFWYVRW